MSFTISSTVAPVSNQTNPSLEVRDDGALSDGGDDMTPEQYGILLYILLCWDLSSIFFSAQMEAALEHVRAELGPELQSGFTDSFIIETLWDWDCDVDLTIESLIGMSIRSFSWQKKNLHTLPKEVHERRNAARERKGELSFLDLVPLGSILYYSTPSPSSSMPPGPT
jgi:HBS1 N-terminus